MYQASDLRKGLRIKLDGDPHIITEFNFVKPGKGQALYRCKLKNMISGAQFERTFRSVDAFEQADLQEKNMQYLYEEDNKYCFMDTETFEQVFLTAGQVGEAKNYLLENIEAEILFFGERALDISLPNSVDMIVTKADPWAKGDSVSGNTKPVTLQTGYVIQVPPFIEEGEKIRVDTRTGRVSDTGQGLKFNMEDVQILTAKRENLRTRARMMQSVRDFFTDREYLEVETPNPRSGPSSRIPYRHPPLRNMVPPYLAGTVHEAAPRCGNFPDLPNLQMLPPRGTRAAPPA